MEQVNPETTLLSRKHIYRGKIVHLLVDTIQLPRGDSAIREVVRHPGGVVAIPVMDDGRLLLIRQFRYALGRYIFEFPAGKLDSDRTPEETIRLELEEEAGYRAAEVTRQFAFFPSPGISNEVIHVYLARGLTPVPRRLEDGEHIEVLPCAIEDCIQKLHGEEIIDGKTLLGLLWYLSKLAGGAEQPAFF